jgi:hypothetical protein
MNKTLILGSLGLIALASACSVDVADPAPETNVGTTEESVSCGNEEGVASVMAALAVSSADEMGRWLPLRDFEAYAPDASKPWDRRIRLSVNAAPRCNGRDRFFMRPEKGCAATKSLLSMQDDVSQGLIVGGQPLHVPTLRDRMISYWDRQKTCIDGGQCPVEYHDLSPSAVTPSSCGSDHWYHAFKMGTQTYPGGPGTNLTYPQQLRNMLIWAGYPENQYLAFYANGLDTKIDPGSGMDEGDNVTSGSCTVGCTMNAPPPAAPGGTCCTCTKTVNGVTTTINGTFQRVLPTSTTNFMYKCQ